MPVTQVGYLALRTAHLDEWCTLLLDVVGAQLRDEGEDGSLYFRFDDRHHRLSLRPADEEGVDAMGFEVATAAELEALAARLAAGGVAVTEAVPEDCALRGVDRMIRFADPDGWPLEVYVHSLVDESGFHAARGVKGFNMGRLGLGHLVWCCPNVHASAKFYQDVLGFKLSDYIRWDGADATFLHCNPRHHSLALMNECFGMKSGVLHHIMIEVADLDDVGRAYDIVQQRKVPLVMTLGRHSNDHMTSFYFKTPSGFAIEYGWGGLLIDDETWDVKSYGSPKIWGHDLVTEAQP